MSPDTLTCRHPQTLRINPRAWERDFPHPQASEDLQGAGWAFVEMSLLFQESQSPSLAAYMFLLLPLHRWWWGEGRNDRRGQAGAWLSRVCLPPTGTPVSSLTTWHPDARVNPQTPRDTLSALSSDQGLQPQQTTATHKRPSSCRSLTLIWREDRYTARKNDVKTYHLCVSRLHDTYVFCVLKRTWGWFS